ncbi:MAG: heavy metal translocating P-type ATPase, partial [Ktedonobacteraceae bacterium]|nr:heavy metal translocating P-type ATPase [Ktedonobacteraceae bacterium]
MLHTRDPRVMQTEAGHQAQPLLQQTVPPTRWEQVSGVIGTALKRYPLPLASLLLLALSIFAWFLGWKELAHWIQLIVVLCGGIPLVWDILRQLLHRELSIDLIAALAILGSLWLGEYLAGAVIVLMLSGGKALEAYALRRARSSLTALAERVPRQAHLVQGDQLLDIPTEAIEIGMTIVIKPGEMVPVDSIILEGEASVSEADLTGEPLPVRKIPGMPVLSGSVNLDSVLHVRANKRSAESHYAQIIHLVQQAQEQKAPIHRLADRYSVVFTAVTLLFASAAWLLSGNSVYALAVLVVATPCPLILATPIAIMAGIDVAARHGIIIKNGGAIELLGEADVAVFDKTGTLTLGTPQVTQIIVSQGKIASRGQRAWQEKQILRAIASVELLSNHILARAIVEAAQERKLSLHSASDVEEIFGKGIQGKVLMEEDGEDTAQYGHLETVVAVGNRTFMRHLQIALPPELLEERERRTARGQIGSFVAFDGQCIGLVVLEDQPRAELTRLAPALKKQGIKHIVLLTGDHEVVAQHIGRLARVDHIIARCLPEKKVQVVQDLVQRGHTVLMVGDGINDAPALAAASIGMALGAQGLTAATSASDSVLLSSDILRVVTAVRLGRQVMRIAKQGI